MKHFDTGKFNKLLNTSKFGRKFKYFDSIDSTNDHATDLVEKSQGVDLERLDGTLILAERQTGGRGRFKHKWLSPQGGLWFSLITITDIRPEELPNLTLIAAFSVSETFMDIYNIDVDIKWPNDLYYGEYKFGGILSELKKDGKFQAIIIGIGINMNIDDKTLDGLDNTATSIRKILGREADRELILARILEDFERSYDYFSTTGDFKSLFSKWEKNIRYQ
ncbi:biotin--[acetyl-CoA-carboxylase] ligase [Actinomycetota bacterium]